MEMSNEMSYAQYDLREAMELAFAKPKPRMMSKFMQLGFIGFIREEF